nr:unnamed protein product [Digitaria exilis]
MAPSRSRAKDASDNGAPPPRELVTDGPASNTRGGRVRMRQPAATDPPGGGASTPAAIPAPRQAPVLTNQHSNAPRNRGLDYAIAYMDNLELPSVERGTHQINYNIPRICNITNADFDFVMQVDRNKLSLVELYGKLPVFSPSFLPLPMLPFKLMKSHFQLWKKSQLLKRKLMLSAP